MNLEEINARIEALIEDEEDNIAKMASIACELYHGVEKYHWVGFYRNIGNNTLKIGPYQGGHGCLTIPFERGVCGACATLKETIIVDDVDSFPDHIPCASSTRSEIVVPVFDSGNELLAVFDIDSDDPAAFNAEDKIFLEGLIQQSFAS